MDTQEREQRIKIYLEAFGVQNVQKALKEIKNSTSILTDSNSKLISQYGSVDKAMSAAAKGYSNAHKSAVKGIKKHIKAVGGLASGYGVLAQSVGEASSGMKSLILPASFGAAITQTIRYNKVILETSALTNRLGIGVSNLEGRYRSLSRETALTLKETASLFDQFQCSIPLCE